jgi:hypothetical protein
VPIRWIREGRIEMFAGRRCPPRHGGDELRLASGADAVLAIG